MFDLSQSWDLVFAKIQGWDSCQYRRENILCTNPIKLEKFGINCLEEANFLILLNYFKYSIEN
jgi:hypothetical protein